MLHTDISYTLPIFQTSKTNGATASGTIDRLGYDYCRISVLLPTADQASNKPTVLKLQEADVTNSSSFADISGFVGGTDFTIPSAITVASNITQPYAVFNVDCRGRKRYLQIVVSPQTTQVINVQAELSRARTTPGTSSQAAVVVGG